MPRSVNICSGQLYGILSRSLYDREMIINTLDCDSNKIEFTLQSNRRVWNCRMRDFRKLFRIATIRKLPKNIELVNLTISELLAFLRRLPHQKSFIDSQGD